MGIFMILNLSVSAALTFGILMKSKGADMACCRFDCSFKTGMGMAMPASKE